MRRRFLLGEREGIRMVFGSLGYPVDDASGTLKDISCTVERQL